MAARKPLVLVGGLPSELPANDTITGGWTALPNATFTEAATLIAIGLGARTVTANVSGLLVGDRIIYTPVTSAPSGYVLGQAYCLTAGVMTVALYGPAVTIGSSLSFTLKVAVLR